MNRSLFWLLGSLGLTVVVALPVSAQNRTKVEAVSGTRIVTTTLAHHPPAIILPPAGQDLDQNGLEDRWEVQRLGQLGVDPVADADGDGLTNLDEYHAQTDPRRPHPGWAYFALPPNLIPLAASPNGVALLRDETHYWRWAHGGLQQLAEYADFERIDPRKRRSTEAVLNRRGEVAIQTIEDLRPESSDGDATWEESAVVRVYPLGGTSLWSFAAPARAAVTDFIDSVINDANGDFVRWARHTFVSNRLLGMTLGDDGTLWGLAPAGVETSHDDSTNANFERLISNLVRVPSGGGAAASERAHVYVFRGLSAKNHAIGQFGPGKMGFIGASVVDYTPSAISAGGQVIGYDGIATSYYPSGPQRLYPVGDNISRALPEANYPFYFDSQERINERSYTGRGFTHFLVTPTGPDGAWRRVPHVPLPMPTGWVSEHRVAPGSESAQLGYVSIHGAAAQPFLALPNPSRLLVDNDHDGTLTNEFPDLVTPEKPFRFWVNDDNDMDGALGANESNGNDIPGQTQNFSSGINESRGIGADYSTSSAGTGVVDGVRDLIDFFPVFLDLKQLLTVLPTTTPGVKYKLKQADGALNFVYTNKTRAQAFDYQRQLLTTGFSDLFDKQPGDATTHRITAEGYELSAAFLSGIKDSDWGVILVEGRAATTAPLVLVVEKDGTAIAEVKLEIKISPVEQMFRHVNLTGSATNYNGSTLTLPASAQPTATGEPAGWPDSQTNGKYFVLVHGYNVDGQKARGWNCEVFKRMHVLGSKARFVGVTWHGATGLDYHKAVYQAFQTGDALNAALNFTGGADVTIAAHSLGNLVVSHAIQSGDFSPSRYYMINAAVPIEAYDLGNVDAAQRTAMVEDDWKSRDARFYASNWHQLFGATPADHRNELSWKNRLIRARRDVEAHNFYSPGEDVVENATTDTAAVGATILNQGFNFAKGAWTAQELVKGVNWTTSLAAAFMERGQGGWDADLAYLFTSNASITNEQLKTRPFFDEFKEDDLINVDPAIASAKAGEAKVQYDLLARGLPALSYAAAANPLLTLSDDRNFNMETKGRTTGQWPAEGHSGGNAGRWLHSDFKNAALPYVYQMYEAMIAKGSLK